MKKNHHSPILDGHDGHGKTLEQDLWKSCGHHGKTVEKLTGKIAERNIFILTFGSGTGAGSELEKSTPQNEQHGLKLTN